MNRDSVAAVVWIFIGIVISIWSKTFPFGDRKAPGPAFLPLACGLILILLGSILLFQRKGIKKEGSPKPLLPLLPRGKSLWRVVITLGTIILSAIFLKTLGFILTVFLMLFCLTKTIRAEKVKAALFYAFVSTLGCVIVFQILLKVRFPKGFFGF